MEILVRVGMTGKERDCGWRIKIYLQSMNKLKHPSELETQSNKIFDLETQISTLTAFNQNLSIKNENLTKELQNLDQSLAAKNNQLIEIQSKLGLSEKNYIKKCQEIEILETKISIISDLQSQITT